VTARWRIRLAGAGVAWWLCAAAGAQAQTVPGPRRPAGPPRVEVSLLGVLVTGGDMGSSSAMLIGNQGPSGPPTPLFQTDTRVSAAAGAELRFGGRLTERLFVEGGLQYTRPDLQVRVSGDLEGAADVTASSPLTQVTVDAGLQYRFGRGRLRPFAMGGVGYLRQLDGPRTTVGTGQVFYGGGGVRYGLGRARPRGGHRVAVRADVRAVSYRGGILDDEGRSLGLVAGAGLTFGLW
jgi:opacity protein-like surface antigen